MPEYVIRVLDGRDQEVASFVLDPDKRPKAIIQPFDIEPSDRKRRWLVEVVRNDA